MPENPHLRHPVPAARPPIVGPHFHNNPPDLHRPTYIRPTYTRQTYTCPTYTRNPHPPGLNPYRDPSSRRDISYFRENHPAMGIILGPPRSNILPFN
jgi:hypothetical protein